MNESEYKTLVEESWRRPLTDDEQIQLAGWLATHPEERAAWEEETALNRSLESLPNSPLSSNFTALVMQAVQRAADPAGRAAPSTAPLTSLWRRLTWHLAWALVIVSAVWLGYRQHQLKVRQDVAKGLSVLANVATLSEPAVLEDFDAIQRLSQASGEDEELYAVLNQ